MTLRLPACLDHFVKVRFKVSIFLPICIRFWLTCRFIPLFAGLLFWTGSSAHPCIQSTVLVNYQRELSGSWRPLQVNQGGAGWASPCFMAANFIVLEWRLQCSSDEASILSGILSLVAAFWWVCLFHGSLLIKALFSGFTATWIMVAMSQEGFFFFNLLWSRSCTLFDPNPIWFWLSITDFGFSFVRACACVYVCVAF